MSELNIHNSSDIGMVCGHCGTNFTGQARYWDELMKMYAKHFIADDQVSDLEPSDSGASNE